MKNTKAFLARRRAYMKKWRRRPGNKEKIAKWGKRWSKKNRPKLRAYERARHSRLSAAWKNVKSLKKENARLRELVKRLREKP